jgi:cystathionine beta-synthase
LFEVLVNNPEARDEKVSDHMLPAFPVVALSDPMNAVAKKMDAQLGAVLVEMGKGKYHIITRHDLVSAMS